MVTHDKQHSPCDQVGTRAHNSTLLLYLLSPEGPIELGHIRLSRNCPQHLLFMLCQLPQGLTINALHHLDDHLLAWL